MIAVKEIREKTQQDKLKKKGLLAFGYRIHRFFSAYLTSFLLSLFPKIKPNFVSFLMIILGGIGLYFIFLGDFYNQFLGILLIYLSFLLDKVDGEIARYKQHITLKGAYLDEIYHVFISSLLISALCFNDLKNNIYFGFLLGVLVFILLNIRYQRKEREFLFLKMFRFIKNDKLTRDKKNGFIWNKILNFLPFKFFGFVERFDLMIFLSLLIILLEKYFIQSSIKNYFFFIYLISGLIYLIKLILLNYFSELNKKADDLFEKYKLWL